MYQNIVSNSMISPMSILETCGFLMLIGFFLCGCCGWCFCRRQKHDGVVLAPAEPYVIVIPADRSTTTGVYNLNSGRLQRQRLVNYTILMYKLD